LRAVEEINEDFFLTYPLPILDTIEIHVVDGLTTFPVAANA
jgi:hypothetical protein